uniref:Ubiquitin-protein ligase, putative n=1 Tax=Arundo donax TaxID=35708 RepID=A0A0A9DGU9_ARUDO
MELQSSWASSAEKNLFLISGYYYLCTATCQKFGAS